MGLRRLLFDVLLQPSQPLLRLLQYLVLLADSESQPVLDDVRVGIGEELSGRDGRYAELLNAEPRELEITRPVGYVSWEWIVGRKLHLGQVDEDEVSTLGFGVL